MVGHYSLITLKRDDLVELSRRIAACVPEHLLKDRAQPVVIAVDGGFNIGKKIFADYGREALVGVKHEDLKFQGVQTFWKSTQRKTWVEKVAAYIDDVKQRSVERKQSIICRGASQHDEYVLCRRDGYDIDVSFVNVQWLQYSFGNTQGADYAYDEHLDRRRAGGVVYVHNSTADIVVPDLEIKLEGNGLDVHVNDDDAICPQLPNILAQIIGHKRLNEHSDWARYVEVRINNAALNEANILSDMLVNEFGFRAKAHVPKAVFVKNGDELTISGDLANFPLAQKYKPYIEAHAQDMAQQPQADAVICVDVTSKTELKI